MRLSIRQRLTAWYAAALLLGLTIFALCLWVELQERLLAGTDARLALRIRGLQSTLGEGSGIRDAENLRRELAEFADEVSDGSLIQLREASGELVLASPKQLVLPRAAAGQVSP